MSNVFDGRSAVLGVVEDISREGLCVSNIPSSFEDTIETCYMVVNGPHGDFYLALKPRWARPANKGMYKTMGFKIDRAPDTWTDFLENVESGKCRQDPFCSMVVGDELEM